MKPFQCHWVHGILICTLNPDLHSFPSDFHAPSLHHITGGSGGVFQCVAQAPRLNFVDRAGKSLQRLSGNTSSPHTHLPGHLHFQGQCPRVQMPLSSTPCPAACWGCFSCSLLTALFVGSPQRKPPSAVASQEGEDTSCHCMNDLNYFGTPPPYNPGLILVSGGFIFGVSLLDPKRIIIFKVPKNMKHFPLALAECIKWCKLRL